LSESKVLAFTEQLEQFVGAKIDTTEIQTLLSEGARDRSSAFEFFKNAADHLTDDGKERLFTSIYSIIVADGLMSQPGRQFADDLARALGFTAAHIGGLMAKLIDSSHP